MLFYNEKKTTVAKGDEEGKKVQTEARVVEAEVRVVAEAKTDARMVKATPAEETEQGIEERTRRKQKRKRNREDPIDIETWDPDGPGEHGKPFKVENPDGETRAAIDKGWKVTI